MAQGNYNAHFLSPDIAEAYDALHRRRPLKRWRTHREARLLSDLLATRPAVRKVLDLPCGSARLTTTILAHAEAVFGIDVAPAQVRRARVNVSGRVNWAVADATRIPLADDAVDGTVCARLLHHLSTLDQRSALLSEIFRVSASFAVVSFTDRGTLHSRWRRLRRAGRPDNAVTVNWLADRARENGMMLLCTRGPYPGSRHRYALFVTYGGTQCMS